jgi:hypothetical protein
MVADVLTQPQLAIEIVPDDVYGLLGWGPDMDFDSLFGKHVLGSLPDATGNDDIHPLIVQPTGENTGLVDRRVELAGVQNLSARGIHVKQSEPLAVPKVRAQPAACDRNRDDKNRF